jgi:ketosteroid isomerase-like protein
MIHRHAAILFVVIASAALGACSERSEKAAAEDVRKQALGVVAAYNAQDAHAAAAYDAPDYVGIYHGQANTIGPAADEASMKTQMASTNVEWTIGEGNVTVAKAGDIGVFEAPYTFAIAMPDGTTTKERGSWIAIFKRQDDGHLKLWRSIASDIPPPVPPAPAT